MEVEIIIITSVFACAWLALLIVAIVLFTQVRSLRQKVAEMQATGRMRIQKLKLDHNDKNHAFSRPVLAPDEELSRRGYSMYQSSEDVEGGRRDERQTGGQFVERRHEDRHTPTSLFEERQSAPHFVDELTRELDSRQQRTSNSPSFLLQSIQDSKMKTRSLANPVANGRQSETNPNFIY
ncbi:hypothetical protein PYW07_003498 [Mythimna separata]|uniref:Uncharacterized protein n=1 Tax=Mythimna separata TaxID=271217 RepID=A0AAD7YJV2_MYTSE|nr:hypothetical protein PYW07_003498 [Mythimna separata]